VPATQHQHHFEDLSPDDLERLIYWLVQRPGGYDEVQSYGGARDKGRDVVAYRHTCPGRKSPSVRLHGDMMISLATASGSRDANRPVRGER
jgi:hypothetical protein